MKTLAFPILAGALIGALLGLPQASGQEEDLQAAPKTQDRRSEGLTELTDTVKNFGFLDYARKLVSKLDKRDRKVDPFGMPMDPKQEGGAELAMPVEEIEGEDVPKTSLQEAVSKFRVTGVYPHRKEVIVGAQSLRVGDRVVIKHGDVAFNLEISKVERDAVELVDQETGEVAGVSLGIVQAIPQGMTRERPIQRQEDDSETRGTIVPMNRRFLTLE